MSGLDSSAAGLVVQHLWAVADGGSVNCTDHTPTTALFSMSVTLCQLSQGRVAYFGLSTDLEAYFTGLSLGLSLPPRLSVAEWVISLANPDFSTTNASVAEDLFAA